jgi:hypothetical protein
MRPVTAQYNRFTVSAVQGCGSIPRLCAQSSTEILAVCPPYLMGHRPLRELFELRGGGTPPWPVHEGGYSFPTPPMMVVQASSPRVSPPDVIAPSCILAVLGSYGPSMAVGSSNYIEIGQSSNWLRTDRGASLNVGASTQGTSRCLGSSGAVAQGTCDRCDQKNAATWAGCDCRLRPKP